MPNGTDELLNLNSGYTIVDNTADHAASLGCVLVAPQANQLQLDIDSNEMFTIYKTRLNILEENFTYNFTEEITPSRSRLPGKYHVTLTFGNMLFSPESRCAWQMMLGSDPVREALSMFGVLMRHTTPSCLFEATTAAPCQMPPQQLFEEMLF